MKLFSRKRMKSSDYVNLSIGKVFFYELKNVDIVNARITAEDKNGVLHNEVYIAYLERRLLPFKNKQYKSLSVKDGEVIRNKVLEVLKKHNLIIEEEKTDFTSAEKEWFEKQNLANKDRLMQLRKS